MDREKVMMATTHEIKELNKVTNTNVQLTVMITIHAYILFHFISPSSHIDNSSLF